MEVFENLKKLVKETIAKYPQLKIEILDLYQLCRDEIEQGESIDHECELCESSIEELIKEQQ